jgi:hypothetical protein
LNIAAPARDPLKPIAMPGSAPFSRFARLSWRDRMLLVEASITLAAASAAIAVLPFRLIVAWVSRSPSAEQGGAAAAARLRWAVEACSRRAPWRALCFQSALCLHIMLRRRGVASQMHYGIAARGQEGLKAHVWLSAGGATLIGGEQVPGFTRVASFPPG